jgi:hypothetical protein
MTDATDDLEARRRHVRPPFGGLTPEEVDAIAERAAKKALEHVYAEVGKSVVRRLLWIIGTVAVGALILLAGKGALPK